MEEIEVYTDLQRERDKQNERNKHGELKRSRNILGY